MTIQTPWCAASLRFLQSAPMKILVIEDEVRLAAYLQKGLTEEGHVVGARAGQGGIAHAGHQIEGDGIAARQAAGFPRPVPDDQLAAAAVLQ